MAKLWGGRFQKSTDKKVDDFNSSIRFDKRMYKQDIKGLSHTLQCLADRTSFQKRTVTKSLPN